MLSLSSLLNPAPRGPSSINRFPPSPASSSPTTSFADDSAFLGRPMIPKHKMPKDSAVFNKSKPKGVINFRPFEGLDEVSLRQVHKFQVYPLGKIQEYSRHIPYNSEKKDFYEKTGRESLEVFQYVFRIPGDDADYAVMWDYNVGLVRMTPFFKCCKYPKTTPAKMLNANPGLKDITHSITGGSIMAQGYWMPYHCAKAVCATFCHNVAGALVPIFGPDFPSLCTPSEAPEFGRMIIDPAIVNQATREADHFRRLYYNMMNPSARSVNGSISPKRERRMFRDPYDDHGRHLQARQHRARKHFITTGGGDSPYATDTDGEISPTATDRDRFLHPPAASLRPTSSSWAPANMLPHYETRGPSPWLSAVPRFTTTAHLPPYPSPHSHSYQPSHLQPHPPAQAQAHQQHQQQQQHQRQQHQTSQSHSHSQPQSQLAQSKSHSHPHPHPHPQPQPQRPCGAKRPAEHIDPDYDYEGCSSQTATGPNTAAASPLEEDNKAGGHGITTSTTKNNNNNNSGTAAVQGADKNAALLLMNLSVRDSLTKGKKGNGRAGRGGGGGSVGTATTASESNSPRDGAFPRTKKVRSNSM